MNMVKPIPSAPVAVNVFGVGESVTSGAAHVWNKNCESAQRKVLNQWHRKPGEIGPLLALRPPMDVIGNRARSFKAEPFRGEIQSGGDAQPIMRNERQVFAF